MTKWCNTCDHKAYCRGGNDIYTMGCSRYIKAKPMTNEEWLHTLNTEQLAEWIAEEKLCRGYFIFPSMDEAIQDAMEWLKQPHQ